MWGFIRIAAVVTAVLIGAAFTLKNKAMVELDYFVGIVEVPVAFVILGFLIVGWLLGVASMVTVLVKMKIKLRESQRATKLAEKEVKNLRNLPIKDEI